MGDRRRMMGLKDRPLTNGVYIEATDWKDKNMGLGCIDYGYPLARAFAEFN